jgi:hypothetical protein
VYQRLRFHSAVVISTLATGSIPAVPDIFVGEGAGVDLVTLGRLFTDAELLCLCQVVQLDVCGGDGGGIDVCDVGKRRRRWQINCGSDGDNDG